MNTTRNFTESSRITAVLGPTNTGKTHLAMERMLGHATGMIGFPLRLLARENYDRAVRVKGEGQVALITGEEKILPARPRYYICTVESMPVDRPVDFLAVDEIQLCGDPDRGHVFTDRLLHARGQEETLFLGAETMAPLIRRLVPGCAFDTRMRFSRLTYAGASRLNRLSRRSAVVAFSVDEVYMLAEMLRRQKGGAAIVMGALSPRTRNAQVELYQSGEVDYLVATDAIGMGLNMDIDHVAFAALEKFDGVDLRRLRAPEVAQIAGRAGRYRKDGTFGLTAGAKDLDEDIIERVETHTLPVQRRLFWRNADLDFRSVAHLLSSLNRPAPNDALTRVRMADDQRALETLSLDSEVADLAKGAPRVGLLWDVCRVPDFRKLHSETHIRLLRQLFLHLAVEKGRLPDDFVAGHVRRVDRDDGDIHALVDRIAGIRVWTYIAHQGNWLHDGAHWQAVTRAIEDRLSDALHDRLTQRFVDRRSAHLLRRLGERAMLNVEVLAADGRVLVEGHEVGRLEGLTFFPVATGEGEHDRAVMNAATQTLGPEIRSRLARLLADEDSVFSLDAAGMLSWRGHPVATLRKGATALRPDLVLLDNALIDDVGRDALQAHLKAWLDRQLETRLGALLSLETAELEGTARGIAYRMQENLGTLPRSQGYEEVDQLVRSLSEDERKSLARARVRLGVGCLFIPELLKPAAQALLAALWSVYNQKEGGILPNDGRVSFPVDGNELESFYLTIGYRVMGTKAIRVDMVERFAADVRRMVREANEKPKPSAEPIENQTETAPLPADQTEPAAEADTAPNLSTDATPLVQEAEGSAESSADIGEDHASVEEPAPAPAEADDAVTPDVVTASSETETPDTETAPAKPAPEAKPGEIHLPPETLPQLGIDVNDGAKVLENLGYRVRLEEGVLFLRPGRRKVDRPERKGHYGNSKTGGDRAKGPKSGNRSGSDGPSGSRGDARRGDKKPFRDRDDKKGPNRDRPNREQQAPRPRKEADPNSPFAVLGTLLKK